ncbi:MAG: CHAT domain-containing protein [Chitinophagales bacterium]|nr:CHAT domain-containing protein [Chitinophagales bacterium]
MRNCHLLLYIVLFGVIYCINTSFQSGYKGVFTTSIEEDTCSAISLLIEHDDLVEKGRYEKALLYIDSASHLYEKHQLWEKYIETLVDIAAFADYLDYDTKAVYAKQALLAAQSKLPANHLLLADAYRQNGEVYTAFQEYDSSLYFYEKALPIFELYQEWEQMAWSKLLQAVNYYYLGKNEAGLKLLEGPFWESENFTKDIYSTLYNLRGIFYKKRGDLTQVIHTTEKALSLELSKSLTDFDSSFVATLYNNMGIAYEAKGDLKRAMDYYQKALHRFQQLPGQTTNQIIGRINIGQLLLSQQKGKTALPYFLENVALLEKEPELPRYNKLLVNNYINLGHTYREIVQYDSAQYYLTRAIETGEKSYLANAHYAQGRYYIQVNQPGFAVKSLETALLNLSTISKKKQVHPSRVYYRLGEAYTQQKNYKEALLNYQQALVKVKNDFTDSLDILSNPSLDGSVYDDIHFLETLHQKARILSLLPDNLESSLSTYLLAIQWTDSLRQTYTLEENELFWSEQFKEIYSEAIHTAYQLFEKTQSQQYLKTAFLLSEKSKSILLLEAFITKTGRQHTSVPQALLDKERDLSIDIAFYEKRYYSLLEEQDSLKMNLFQNYLRDARLELANLKEKIETAYPDYYQLKYQDEPFDPIKTQASLPDRQTALIEYFIGEKHAYAFVLGKDVLQMIPLEHPESIQQYLSQFKPLLFDTKSFLSNPKQTYQQFNAGACSLYNGLLKEAIEKLPTDISQLIIVPDEGLNTLPFEVLNTDLINQASSNFGQLPYLIKKYQIQYTYSIKLLEKNQERHSELQPNIQCLAFAPSYKDTNPTVAQVDIRSRQLRNGISVLENTAAEVNAIDQYFDGYFMASANATKANFLEKAPHYGILHLAMHGEADFENTKFGHLIFSNADTNALEHNILYHYEIANLDLNAQLAVLSACETGVGKYESGEGVFSIARSFMYAGVPSIVMSLWKVNDRSTSQLMPSYYKKLASGMNKSQALRTAKLEFLEEAGLEYRHPFYWASFVALGDQQALRRSFPSGLIIAGICVLLIGAVGYYWYRNKE